MAHDLVIYGTGGMGHEIADLVHGAGQDGAPWRLLGFVDDDEARHGREVVGLPVLGGLDWVQAHHAAVVVAVGAPAARRRVWQAVTAAGAAPAPGLVHPSAHVGGRCTIGAGTVVGAHATLTTDVHVGAFAIVNVGVTVSHQCELADLATVAPGAHLAGAVRLGEGADIGIGASVIQGRTVGAWSIVGAGAVVVADVDANTTVVGCPARPVATRPDGWHR